MSDAADDLMDHEDEISFAEFRHQSHQCNPPTCPYCLEEVVKGE